MKIPGNELNLGTIIDSDHLVRNFDNGLAMKTNATMLASFGRDLGSNDFVSRTPSAAPSFGR